MADRGSNRTVTFTEPISALPAINVGTGAPQLFGQITEAFTGLASTSAERLSRFRVEQAGLEGIVAAESDNPQLIKDARTLADVTRNRSFRTSFSQRLNDQFQVSLLKALDEFPADSIAFQQQIGLELTGMAEEIEKATPALAPAWIARAQAKIDIKALGVQQRENAEVDEATVVGINEAARSDTQWSASVGALMFDTGPTGNSVRDIMASQFVEFEDMLHQQNAANNGPLLSVKEIDKALVQYAQSIANEAFFGLMESSAQIPGGPTKLRDDLNAGKITVLAHDRTDGEFTVIEVPIKALLGNRQIAQANSHLTALENRQKQDGQSATEAEKHKARGIASDAIQLAGRGRMSEFPLSELGALPPGEVLNAQDKFDDAIIKHEMSTTVLQGEPADVFGLLADIDAQAGSSSTAEQAAGFRRLDQWTELFEERAESIVDDSYQWVLGASPQAGLAIQAMTPAEAHDFLDGEFDRLGVPVADRRYIPKDTAAELEKQINSLDTAFERAGALQTFRISQGIQAPRILNTLAKDGLPEEFIIAAQMDNVRAATRYLDAVELGEEELRKLIPSDIVRSIEDELKSFTGQFNAVLRPTIPPGNDRVAAAQNTALRHTAFSFASRGHDATAASASAWATLYGSTRFIGTVRVPAPFGNSTRLAGGLRNWRRLINPDDILVSERFGDPRLAGLQSQLEPERRERYMESLLSSGVPYTEPLGRGINIWILGEVVKDVSGNPLMLEWETVKLKADVPRVERQQREALQRLGGPI